MLAYVNNGAKIEQARISSGFDDGEQAYEDNQDMASALEHPLKPVADAITQSQGQMALMLAQMMEQQGRAKQVIRDQNGKIVGVQ